MLFHWSSPPRETKARKAVTYNYACMLVLVVVQSSSDLSMMEQYATPLLTLAKADDTNAKLQGRMEHPAQLNAS